MCHLRGGLTILEGIFGVWGRAEVGLAHGVGCDFLR